MAGAIKAGEGLGERVGKAAIRASSAEPRPTEILRKKSGRTKTTPRDRIVDTEIRKNP